jgi:hypothetical protein
VEINRYISNLSLAPPSEDAGSPIRIVPRGLGSTSSAPAAPPALSLASAAANDAAVVNANSVLSFVAGLAPDEVNDVILSVQLAQRGATGAFDRFTQSKSWYQKYTEILENLGWAGEQLAFAQYDQSAGQLQMDKAALDVITAIATQQQLVVLTKSLDALRKLAEGDEPMTVFEYNALAQASGNFQIGAVQKAPNGMLAMAMGGFYFRSVKQQKRFLFWSWGAQEINFWTAAQKLSFNRQFYTQFREEVATKLGAGAATFLATLTLAAPV